jgi:hypothetical protein
MPTTDRPSRPTMRGARAGSLVVATIVLCGALGLGAGAVAGVPVPLGIAGVFIGAVIGNVVVARRFGDL